MNTRLKTLMAVGILAGFAMPASAVPLLEIVPTAGDYEDPMVLPSYNYHGNLATAGLEGYYNANLKALGTLGIQTTLTFMFADPDGVLKVSTNGTEHASHLFDWPGDSVNGGETATGDWVDFAIKLLGGGTVVNGSNNSPTPYGSLNFWLGYADLEQTAVIVAVEDGLGEGGIGYPDQDDLIFMISAKPVSEPATLSLLGAGLLLTGLGVRSRRRDIVKA